MTVIIFSTFSWYASTLGNWFTFIHTLWQSNKTPVPAWEFLWFANMSCISQASPVLPPFPLSSKYRQQTVFLGAGLLCSVFPLSQQWPSSLMENMAQQGSLRWLNVGEYKVHKKWLLEEGRKCSGEIKLWVAKLQVFDYNSWWLRILWNLDQKIADF